MNNNFPVDKKLILSNPFRNSQNQLLTRQLFFELKRDPLYVKYTLHDHDHEGYPSLYRLYMEANDPTEYHFANSHLEGWAHWKLLSEQNWFKPYVTRWREEMALLLEAEGLRVIRQKAGDPSSKDALAAAKFLASKNKSTAPTAKRGRPTKAVEIQDDLHQVEDDFERVMN